MKERIIQKAYELFFQFGVRSVSMDDVAKELSMSKKTLYQHFSNKDELVTEVAFMSVNEQKQRYKNMSAEAENALDELRKITTCIKAAVKSVNPVFLYDLRKYHPVSWEIFQGFKYEFIFGTIKQNIMRGISEGIYRSTINPEILAALRIEEIQLVFDGSFKNLDVSYPEIQMQLIEHFVYGLLSKKGYEQYLRYCESQANSL